jgi:hypothetical protein
MLGSRPSDAEEVLFGFALRQTTGFVESPQHPVGLTYTMPDFSTLSRKQKSLTVDIPYRGSRGFAPSSDRQHQNQGPGRR